MLEDLCHRDFSLPSRLFRPELPDLNTPERCQQRFHRANCARCQFRSTSHCRDQAALPTGSVSNLIFRWDYKQVASGLRFPSALAKEACRLPPGLVDQMDPDEGRGRANTPLLCVR